MLRPEDSETFTGPWCGSHDGWRPSVPFHGSWPRSRPALAGIFCLAPHCGPRFERSDLFDLTEFQFYGRRAAEDGDCDLDARTCLVDFLDHTGERGERPVGHAHVFADFDRH